MAGLQEAAGRSVLQQLSVRAASLQRAGGCDGAAAPAVTGARGTTVHSTQHDGGSVLPAAGPDRLRREQRQHGEQQQQLQQQQGSGRS